FIKSAIFFESLKPSVSTPLETSIKPGATAAAALPTLPGFKPPARESLDLSISLSGSSDQLKATPLPPQYFSLGLSISIYSAGNSKRSLYDNFEFEGKALIARL